MALTVADGVAWILAAAFVLAGWLNLSGPSFVAAEFEAWGYPPALRWSVGMVEWAVACVLLLVPAWRSAAAIVGIAVLAGVLVSLWRSRAWLRMEYPLVLLLLLLLLALA